MSAETEIDQLARALFAAWHGGRAPSDDEWPDTDRIVKRWREVARVAIARRTPASQPSGSADAWKPIETAPKDGSLILLVIDGKVESGGWVELPYEEVRDEAGRYISQQDPDAFWLGYQSGETNPTHWMPLPKPPIASTPSEEKQ